MPTVRRLHVVALSALCCGLVAAPPASAKGIARLAVCGATGCVDRTGLALRLSPEPHLLLDSGTPVSAQSVAGEPFVRVRFGIGDDRTHEVFGRYTVAFLPRSGRLRAQDGTWGALESETLRAMRRVVAGVPRLAAAGLHLPAANAAREPAPAAPSRHDAASTAWLVVSGAIALAALLAAGAVAARRRRAAGGPAM